MKILYNAVIQNHVIAALSEMPDWDVYTAADKKSILKCCTSDYYDVLILDSTLDFNWLDTIKEIRARQIFTPILLITEADDHKTIITGLADGADMCISCPVLIREMVLRIRVLKRRNTNYQSPIILYEGIELNRPNSKLAYNGVRLSVTPTEIEIFRLLTRASSSVSVKRLAEKMNETEDKVVFSIKCLQKKIELLDAPIKLEFNGSEGRLIKIL